jgi:hypothetical protein
VLVSSTGEGYSPEVAALLLGAWAIGALAAGVIAYIAAIPDHTRRCDRRPEGQS